MRYNGVCASAVAALPRLVGQDAHGAVGRLKRQRASCLAVNAIFLAGRGLYLPLRATHRSSALFLHRPSARAVYR